MAEQTSSPSERPGPDQLAGVYILIEGEERSFVSPPEDRPAPASGETPPTVEQLAGLNLRLEGNEWTLLPSPGPSSEAPS